MKITKEIEIQIREIVKDEVYSIFFEKKTKQIPLKSYIKYLVTEQISNYKKKLVPAEYIFHEEDQIQMGNSFYIDFKKSIEVHYEKLVSEKIIDCNYEHFLGVLNSEIDDSICWMDKSPRSKQYQFATIFDFLNDVSNADLTNLNDYNKKKLFNTIITKFTKNGESIAFKNVDSSFRGWLEKQNKA